MSQLVLETGSLGYLSFDPEEVQPQQHISEKDLKRIQGTYLKLTLKEPVAPKQPILTPFE